MPAYEYKCEACKEEFTMILSFSEHENGDIRCPKCQSDRIIQLVSAFTPKTGRKSYFPNRPHISDCSISFSRQAKS
ncbi:MAG: zinc ribbon domain-containing protein [Syntrophobacter sp.]